MYLLGYGADILLVCLALSISAFGVLRVSGQYVKWKDIWNVTLLAYATSWVVRAVGSIIVILVMTMAHVSLAKGDPRELLLTNLGWLAAEKSSYAVTFVLSSMDICTIYMLALVAYGCAIINQINHRHIAVIAAFAPWLLYVTVVAFFKLALG